LSAWLAALLAAGALAGAPEAAEPAAARTALVHFADGNTLPLREWTLAYGYVTWQKGQSPALAATAERASDDLWLGKRALPLAGTDLRIEYGELRRETLVEGRPQAILSSAAREVTVTGGDGKAAKVKVEPPSRELLLPGADKATNVLARSLDLRGVGITGTRREVCVLSYSTLVDCGSSPADQVVRVEFR
jgi:hypothetical protein